MATALSGGKPATLSGSLQPKFEHKALDINDTAFRLLRVLPRKSSEHVRCEVISTNLISAPPFQALSYAWGHLLPTQAIEVNGRHLAVRQNLWHFLDFISTETSADMQNYIFIDQICIDQENVLERNHQVHQMASIYSAAKEVIIWIMPASGLGRNWFDTVHDDSNHDPKIVVPRQCAYRQLWADEYWGRMWIFQEIAVAKKVTLRWGSATTDFLDIVQKWKVLPTPWLFESDVPTASIEHLSDACRQFRGLSGPDRFSWHELLYLCHGRRCEDPRDQIYALLGIVKETCLRPDYSKSVEAVFQDWVRLALNQEQWPSEKAFRRCREAMRRRMGLGDEDTSGDISLLGLV